MGREPQPVTAFRTQDTLHKDFKTGNEQRRTLSFLLWQLKLNMHKRFRWEKKTQKMKTKELCT